MADLSKLKPNENFWDLNGYKKVVKRTEDGRKMCDFLLQMIDERANIEKNYSDKLSSWYKKWTHAVEKSSEYGTNKEMLKNVVAEGDKLSDVHVKIKDALINLVNSKIRNWRDENYRKQLCTCKPASTFKSEFQKAQKPWADQSAKVDKFKKEYFKYCQQSSVDLAQEEIIEKSDVVYPKVKDKCDKSTAAMDVTKLRYEESLAELELLKPAYVTEMNNVFEAAQEFETKRLEFFKEILLKMTENYQMSKISSIQEIYRECKECIASSDPRGDTQWWAENHGTGMNLLTSSFQDVNPVILETITRGRLRLVEGASLTVFPDVEAPAEQVVRVEIVEREASTGRADVTYSVVDNQREASIQDESEFDLDTSRSLKSFDEANEVDKNRREDDGGLYSTLNDAHIYCNDVETEEGEQEQRAKVKALYDYKGQNKDELSFEKGDIFQMLKEKDGRGWSTGQKNGKVGLFPSTYVEAC